jgi:hypothetical protein
MWTQEVPLAEASAARYPLHGNGSLAVSQLNLECTGDGLEW